MKYGTQIGRSMIEMLGVLAIIGVLSVGGIAGYSKAMMKYRINRSVDQIVQAVTRTRVAFVAQKNYKGLGSTPEEVGSVLFNANIITPDYSVRDIDGNPVIPYRFKNPFKGNINIRIADKVQDGDNGAFVIHYDFIPKQACIEIATNGWGGTNGDGYIALAINEPMPKTVRQGYCTPSPVSQMNHALHCSQHAIMLKEAAAHACSDKKDNWLEFMFY